MTLICINFSAAQNEVNFFQKIDEIGSAFVARLKAGDIAYLKKATQPKSTWTFSRLETYKAALNLGQDIKYDSYIEPSQERGVYGYNFVAYRSDNDKAHYYYIAVVTINTNTVQFEIKTSYLFTEKKSVRNWWSHAYGFYQSESVKFIPDQFLFNQNPIPPSNQ
jgi:hypothetical protein